MGGIFLCTLLSPALAGRLLPNVWFPRHLTHLFLRHRRQYHQIMSSDEYVASSTSKTHWLIAGNRATKNEPQIDSGDGPKSPTEHSQPAGERKRPRLDLSAALGGRERKRGKSMFGLLVGTLNKAKIEDKERNASEAVRFGPIVDRV